ncbi:hypothetical protein LINPERHAP2_LOCUS37070 [Linum perenne]
MVCRRGLIRSPFWIVTLVIIFGMTVWVFSNPDLFLVN